MAMGYVRVSLKTFLFRSYVQELMSCAVFAFWCLLIEEGIGVWFGARVIVLSVRVWRV